MRRLVTVLTLGLALVASGSPTLRADAPPPTTLAASSYYGSAGWDEANDVVVGADGSVYVAGWTESFGGTGFDAFVVKLSPDGSQKVYDTRIGGTGFDIAMGLAVDDAGNVFVAGYTNSIDFPVVGGFQNQLNGDFDVWIAKLDGSGSVVRATYYGGAAFDSGVTIARGPTGAVYVAGNTGSTDLPGAGGFQPAHGGGSADAFVLKLASDLSGLTYATYLGGGDDEFLSAIAVDNADHAYVVGGSASANFPLAGALQPTVGGGKDGFVSRLSPDLTQLTFSSYLGGFDEDHIISVDVDAVGAIYLAGSTWSFDFPTRNAYQPNSNGGGGDAFVTKLTPGGAAFVFSTYFGAIGYDTAVKVVADDAGNAHVGGQTDSPVWPLVGEIQQQVMGVDAFYANFSTDGAALVRSTPLGGSGFDVAQALAVGPSGDAWIAGRTDSLDFPLVGAFQSSLGGSNDAFVSRLTFANATPVNEPPVARAGDDLTVYTSGCAAIVVLDGSQSTDADGDALQFTWSGDFGSASGPSVTLSLLPGHYTFTLSVDDGHGGTASDTVAVAVVDNAPPQIGSLSASPNVLSPPNHQMIDVSVQVALTSACETGSTCRIVGVTSSDPDNGVGDGDTSGDWEITGALTLRLRAERGSHSERRTYSIMVECVDEAGNRSSKTVTVSVPK